MLIKYKGKTSELLKDIALESKIPMDLKRAEKIMVNFFSRATKDLSVERSIELITALPSYIKPFCQFYSGNSDSIEYSADINQAIMKVLEKHVNPENLSRIYACFPESVFPQTFLMKKMNINELVKK